MRGINTHYGNNNNNNSNDNNKHFATQERDNFHLSLDNISARELMEV